MTQKWLAFSQKSCNFFSKSLLDANLKNQTNKQKKHQSSEWLKTHLTLSYILPHQDPFLSGNYRLLFQIRHRFIEFPAVQLRFSRRDDYGRAAWMMELIALGSRRKMLQRDGVFFFGGDLEYMGKNLTVVTDQL